MTPRDLWEFLLETLRAQRLRSLLTVLGIVIGIGSVVVLGSLGEGARQGIAAEFGQFGTTVVAITPGTEETFGIGPGVFGGTTKPLTVEDAMALRRVPGAKWVTPHALGLGEVKSPTRRRRVYVYGTTSDDEHLLRWGPRIGSFLPPGDPDRIPPVCVLGATTAKELFPDGNPLSGRIRVGEHRFTVVGVMKPKGQMFGFDMDDMVFIPIRRALRIFNRNALMEICLYVQSHEGMDRATAEIRRILIDRHNGEEDFTILTHDDMLAVINEVLDVLTVGVIVVASISIFVGAMGILTIMWISVHERKWEIGLMKAVGASDAQVRGIFLAEAAALSLVGGLLGLALGLGLAAVLSTSFPNLWIRVPGWILPAALGVSLVVGLAAGLLPAFRAARLDPVDALRAE